MTLPSSRFAATVGLLMLVTLGAGCNFSPTPAPVPAEPPASPSTSTTKTPETPTTTPSGTSTVPPVAKPEGWKTQTNSAAGYSFDWPPTGKYAPQWGTLQASEKGTKIKDGCYVSAENGSERKPSKKIMVGDIEFCQTSYGDPGMSQLYLTDFLAAKNGSMYQVLKLEKHLTSAGVLDCSFKDGYVTKQSGCSKFAEEEYQQLIEQMVGTWKWVK